MKDSLTGGIGSYSSTSMFWGVYAGV